MSHTSVVQVGFLMVGTSVNSKLQITNLEALFYWQAAFILALIAALVTTAPQRCRAETTAEDSDFFIPNDLHFYNPLKHSDGTRKKNYTPNSTGMDNKALAESAAHFRNSDLSAAQRALNYQWLNQQHNESDIKEGGKVLSKIFKMGFKTYWHSKHKDSELSDADLHGDLSEEMSYDVRISGDKLNFSFEYEF